MVCARVFSPDINRMLYRFLNLASDFCVRLQLSGAQSLRTKCCLLLNHELGTYRHCVHAAHSIGCSCENRPQAIFAMLETRNSVRQRVTALTNVRNTKLLCCSRLRYVGGLYGIFHFSGNIFRRCHCSLDHLTFLLLVCGQFSWWFFCFFRCELASRLQLNSGCQSMNQLARRCLRSNRSETNATIRQYLWFSRATTNGRK